MHLAQGNPDGGLLFGSRQTIGIRSYAERVGGHGYPGHYARDGGVVRCPKGSFVLQVGSSNAKKNSRRFPAGSCFIASDLDQKLRCARTPTDTVPWSLNW
jgi:hypothetical protein